MNKISSSNGKFPLSFYILNKFLDLHFNLNDFRFPFRIKFYKNKRLRLLKINDREFPETSIDPIITNRGIRNLRFNKAKNI